MSSQVPPGPDEYDYTQSEADAAKAAKIQEAILGEIRGNFLVAFGSPQGQAVIAWLYERCRMGVPTFVAGDPYRSAYLEGRRSVLLEIQGILRLDDEELFNEARNVSRQGVAR